ncbi:MAG: DUF2284 domain-containing protein [Bacteroidales bacterium]
MNIYKTSFDKIAFEERVKLKCFHCKRYSVNWTCPPKIIGVDYKKILSEYDNLAIIAKSFEYNNLTNLNALRFKSTNELHKEMLEIEKILFGKNEIMAQSFIGGSCKLCKNGCGKEKCNNPEKARIPIEALGINVIKTLENIGIKVVFSSTKHFFRIGLLTW